jgi:hypothetical protein
MIPKVKEKKRARSQLPAPRQPYGWIVPKGKQLAHFYMAGEYLPLCSQTTPALRRERWSRLGDSPEGIYCKTCYERARKAGLV